jgi:hypothetical protein
LGEGSGSNVVSSFENCPRERCSQAANPVTRAPGAVQSIGQPIISSKKRGLEIRPASEEFLPCGQLSRAGSEERSLVRVRRQPSTFVSIQKIVQTLAEFEREN